MLNKEFKNELKRLTNFVFDNEKQFLEFIKRGYDNKEFYYELINVSFDDENVRIVILYDNNEQCIHFSDSIPLLQLEDFLKEYNYENYHI